MSGGPFAGPDARRAVLDGDVGLLRHSFPSSAGISSPQAVDVRLGDVGQEQCA
jgi:hypothetical protein